MGRQAMMLSGTEGICRYDVALVICHRLTAVSINGCIGLIREVSTPPMFRRSMAHFDLPYCQSVAQTSLPVECDFSFSRGAVLIRRHSEHHKNKYV